MRYSFAIINITGVLSKRSPQTTMGSLRVDCSEDEGYLPGKAYAEIYDNGLAIYASGSRIRVSRPGIGSQSNCKDALKYLHVVKPDASDIAYELSYLQQKEFVGDAGISGSAVLIENDSKLLVTCTHPGTGHSLKVKYLPSEFGLVKFESSGVREEAVKRKCALLLRPFIKSNSPITFTELSISPPATGTWKAPFIHNQQSGNVEKSPAWSTAATAGSSKPQCSCLCSGSGERPAKSAPVISRPAILSVMCDSCPCEAPKKSAVQITASIGSQSPRSPTPESVNDITVAVVLDPFTGQAQDEVTGEEYEVREEVMPNGESVTIFESESKRITVDSQNHEIMELVEKDAGTAIDASFTRSNSKTNSSGSIISI
jgi:hypothetical protein